jgi:hypothetical protein
MLEEGREGMLRKVGVVGRECELALVERERVEIRDGGREVEVEA